MNSIFELVKNKENERDYALHELKVRTKFANNVLQDVYENRNKQMKFKQNLISSLLTDGDFETAKEKMAELEEFLKQSPDEEIKAKLEDYNSINCKKEM